MTISDCGPKLGLKGVDNGRLAFDAVRVPRTNLLNRYADITADGEYTSPIDNPDRRFFTMLGTLVQGRVSIGGAGLYASRVALAIADPLRQPAPAVRAERRCRGDPDVVPNPSTAVAARCSRGPTP